MAKFVTFTKKDLDKPILGVLVENMVLDLRASNNNFPIDLLSLIQGGESMQKLVKEVCLKPQKSNLYSLSDVKIKAPLLNPPSLKDFFAFEEHAKAGAKRRNENLPSEWYEIPAYYKGNHRAIFGMDDEIPCPYYTKNLDFECEIACVVGKSGKNISVEKANDYIFGYMIFNDFSARDIQKKEMMLRMGPAKSKDFANSFGPYLVTKDEVNPKKDFQMIVKVNGELWSEGHFKDQYWDFPLLVSHVSQEEEIYPGDILGSGTFYKGCGLDLDRWIQPEDTIELEVNKLGTLRNKIGKPTYYKELTYKIKETTR